MRHFNSSLIIVIFSCVVCTLTCKVLTEHIQQDSDSPYTHHSILPTKKNPVAEFLSTSPQQLRMHSQQTMQATKSATTSATTLPQATMQPTILSTNLKLKSEKATPTIIGHDARYDNTYDPSYTIAYNRNTNKEVIPPLSIANIKTAMAIPFAAEAPRVIASSGDIQPFQQRSPRKAPPGTGDGGVNDNTGVWEDASLADGTWILLLLSVMMLCFKISTKKTKS